MDSTLHHRRQLKEILEHQPKSFSSRREGGRPLRSEEGVTFASLANYRLQILWISLHAGFPFASSSIRPGMFPTKMWTWRGITYVYESNNIGSVVHWPIQTVCSSVHLAGWLAGCLFPFDFADGLTFKRPMAFAIGIVCLEKHMTAIMLIQLIQSIF